MQFVSRLFAASLLLAVPLAFAEPTLHMNAADSKASVPAIQYESAFSVYVSREVGEVADWKEANAKAGSGSGHAGHNMGHAVPEAPPEQNNSQTGHQH